MSTPASRQGGGRLGLARFGALVVRRRAVRAWHRHVRRDTDQAARSRGVLEQGGEIPRTIWMYWAQGWDKAPLLARLSLLSWIERNPGWQVVALDAPRAADHVDLPPRMDAMRLGHAHRADIVRVALLSRYAGVWADATTICGRALDDWLPVLMPAGFFAFARPGPDRLISNWFLAAAKGNALMGAWQQRVRQYCALAKKAHAYHWSHYLFEQAVAASPETRRIWEATPRLSNHLANLVQYNALDRSLHGAVAHAVAEGRIPVHKLSLRLDIPPVFAGTPLAAVLGAGSLAEAEQRLQARRSELVRATGAAGAVQAPAQEPAA